MTVKWIIPWQPNPGTIVNSQIVTEVSQCVESLNSVKDGRWKSIITLYKPMIREQAASAEFPKDFLGVALHEQPSKYYFILRGQRLVVEADSTIQMIMEKLQSYKARLSLTFEGFQYQLGDFKVRVGRVVPSLTEQIRGVMMEVEYLPISSVEKSRQIMEEFLDIWQETVSKKSLPGHFVHNEFNFSEFGLPDHYTSQHTTVQYAVVMAQLLSNELSDEGDLPKDHRNNG